MLPILAACAALRLFGAPAHQTRRATSVSFWALDISGGAGAISSPVLTEHPKNASECAMLCERIGSRVAEECPPWLLLSALGVITRELTSRQVQDGIVPALVKGRESGTKANFLAKQLRQNFDDRIQRVLAPGGYGNAERIVRRFVDAELTELDKTIKTIDDVVSHEITQAVMEVVEVEVAERIQTTISDAVQLNQSAAAKDLYDIFQKADADGNDIITLDELFELVAGKPMDPFFAPIARVGSCASPARLPSAFHTSRRPCPASCDHARLPRPSPRRSGPRVTRPPYLPAVLTRTYPPASRRRSGQFSNPSARPATDGRSGVHC